MSESARWAEAARSLADAGPAAPLPDSAPDRLAAGWALKELCHAAWSSEPSLTPRVATALRRLSDAARADAAAGEASTEASALHEIDALADWAEGIAEVTLGHMSEACAAFDRARAGFVALGQATHAAQTQVPKTVALIMLGRHDEALACAEAALREFVSHGDRASAGKLALNLGSMHLRRDAYEAARKSYREAAVLFARAGDREHSIMADIGLADALTALCDLDEAARIYARARMRAESHGFPVLQAMIDESMALLELVRGRYREALAGLERSRRRYEAMEMPQHLAIAEKQLGDAYLELRLLPEALAQFDAALLRMDSLEMPDDRAWTLAQRGRAQALLGAPQPAGVSLAQAAEAFARQHNAVGAATVELARAELAQEQGAHAEAECHAASAARVFGGAGLQAGRLRSEAVRADALLGRGQVVAARELFLQVLAQARASQQLGVQVRCLSGAGVAARRSGEDAAAQAAFEAAIELFEDQRSALPGDEIRGAFLSGHLLPYEELLRLALQVGTAADAAAARDASGQAPAVRVLLALDRYRACVLNERLASPGSAGEPGDATLRARLNWLYRHTLRLERDAQPSPALDAEMRSIERTLLERGRRARLAAAAAAPATGDGSAPLDIDELRRSLGEDGALVEYGVLDDELFACVVTGRAVKLCRGLAR